MPKKDKDPLLNILKSIDQTLTKQTSLRSVFVLGLMRGFGTALGATVLLAIATSITIQFVDTFNAKTFTEYIVEDLISP
jgi:hypothetical protein